MGKQIEEDYETHDKMPAKDQFNSLDQIQENEQKPSPTKSLKKQSPDEENNKVT